jgi:hypothetical protein
MDKKIMIAAVAPVSLSVMAISPVLTVAKEPCWADREMDRIDYFFAASIWAFIIALRFSFPFSYGIIS